MFSMRIHRVLRRLVWDPTRTLSILRPLLGKQILDLGCGFGHFSYILATKMPEAKVLGVDVSRRKIENAKKTYRLPNLDFQTGDARDLQTGQKWDTVFACDLFHHLSRNDFEEVLGNIQGLIRDTGILIIKDINGDSHLRHWNTIHDLIINRQMPTYNSTIEWRRLLQDQGFQIEREIVSTQALYQHIYFLCRIDSEKNET